MNPKPTINMVPSPTIEREYSAIMMYDRATERVIIGPEIAPNMLGDVFYLYRFGVSWEAFHYFHPNREPVTLHNLSHPNPWASWLRGRNDEIMKEFDKMDAGEPASTSPQRWHQIKIKAVNP